LARAMTLLPLAATYKADKIRARQVRSIATPVTNSSKYHHPRQRLRHSRIRYREWYFSSSRVISPSGIQREWTASAAAAPALVPALYMTIKNNVTELIIANCEKIDILLAIVEETTRFQKINKREYRIGDRPQNFILKAE